MMTTKDKKAYDKITKRIFILCALLFVAMLALIYIDNNLAEVPDYLQRVPGIKSGDVVRISINTAPAAELVKIPGVGPVIAQRIIDYREAQGAFKALEDLKEVKGIGDEVFKVLKNYIEL